jgi:hypothetical protein
MLQSDIPRATDYLLAERLGLLMIIASQPQCSVAIGLYAHRLMISFLMRKHPFRSFLPITVRHCGKELLRDEKYGNAREIFAASNNRVIIKKKKKTFQQ